MAKCILVTGSIRSGTTWVGKIISQSKRVYYIHEPLPNIPYKNDTYRFIWEDLGLLNKEEKVFLSESLNRKIFFSFSETINNI